MARSRRADWHRKGPLLGVNRTKSPRARIDEIDHTRHNVCSGSWSRENAVAWRSDRMDHLFDCEFHCEYRYARWLSVDLGKTISVVPELTGFSHSQGHKLPRRGASKRLLRRSFSLLQIAPTSNDRQKRAKTFHMQQASASSPADLSSEWRTSERSMPPGEHAASRFNFKVIRPTPELCDGRDHYRAFRQVTIMKKDFLSHRVICASWIGADELSPHFCSEKPQIRR